MTLTSTKMGLHEWSYSNNYDPGAAPEDEARRAAGALLEDDGRSRRRASPPSRRAHEVERCLNCDVQTHFTDSLCIECDACIDICPDGLPDDHARTGEEARPAPAHAGAGDNLDQPLFSPSPLKQTGRLMVKDENVCLHCGLCAERCPTYAWDMRKFVRRAARHAGTAFIPLEAVGQIDD